MGTTCVTLDLTETLPYTRPRAEPGPSQEWLDGRHIPATSAAVPGASADRSHRRSGYTISGQVRPLGLPVFVAVADRADRVHHRTDRRVGLPQPYPVRHSVAAPVHRA